MRVLIDDIDVATDELVLVEEASERRRPVAIEAKRVGIWEREELGAGRRAAAGRERKIEQGMHPVAAAGPKSNDGGRSCGGREPAAQAPSSFARGSPEAFRTSRLDL